jgi:hypothetical protein
MTTNTTYATAVASNNHLVKAGQFESPPNPFLSLSVFKPTKKFVKKFSDQFKPPTSLDPEDCTELVFMPFQYQQQTQLLLNW